MDFWTFFRVSGKKRRNISHFFVVICGHPAFVVISCRFFGVTFVRLSSADSDHASCEGSGLF